MDLEVEIKEEPVWLQETSNTSLVPEMTPDGDNIKDTTGNATNLNIQIPAVQIVPFIKTLKEDGNEESFQVESTVTHLKEETKPEITGPESAQSIADIKDEISITEQTNDELVPLFKEENRVENDADLIVDTGEWMHHCTVCRKIFSHPFKLSKHMLFHSGERPYQCTQCSSKFTRKFNLKIHMKIHSEERPYGCDKCNSTFKHKNSLINHMVIHSGDRKYCCKVCCRTFAQRNGLLKHMRTHTGERPYYCGVCHSTFPQRSHLRTHMVIHTGERPYICEHCNGKFIRRCHLRRHMITHFSKGACL